jgi:hypothetical protein
MLQHRQPGRGGPESGGSNQGLELSDFILRDLARRIGHDPLFSHETTAIENQNEIIRGSCPQFNCNPLAIKEQPDVNRIGTGRR